MHDFTEMDRGDMAQNELAVIFYVFPMMVPAYQTHHPRGGLHQDMVVSTLPWLDARLRQLMTVIWKGIVMYIGFGPKYQPEEQYNLPPIATELADHSAGFPAKRELAIGNNISAYRRLARAGPLVQPAFFTLILTPIT